MEATLELVWERTKWPSDETIDSLWDLHRVRRDVVIEWFSRKRKEAQDNNRRGMWAGNEVAMDVEDAPDVGTRETNVDETLQKDES